MATLALTVVGSAVGTAIGGPPGGAIGASVGGLIGAYLDTTYVFPAIFGIESISGPRLRDQPVMTGQEGSPMHWVLGPRNRVGTTVIWKSDLIEVKRTESTGKGGGGDIKTYEYFVDIALGVCDTTDIPGNAINRIVKIYADTKLIYDGSTAFVDKYDSVTIYDGSQSTIDPLIASYEGETNTPTFRRTCYIVINRLNLADYGNRIPNINVVVEQANPWSLQETVDAIMQRTGYEQGEFVGNRMGQCVSGYNVSGPQVMNKVLAPLTLAYNLNVQERDMVIHFMPKGSEDQMIVESADDLAAHSPDDDAPRPLDTTDNDDFDLPSEVVTRFHDYTHDLEQGSQTQKRWDHVSHNRVTLDLPIAFSPSEALNVSKRYLWLAEGERQRTTLSLPPKYLALREGMSLLTPGIGGRQREIWVRRVSIGYDYRVEVEGSFYQPDVYDVDSTLDDTSNPDIPYEPPPTIAVIADLPSMSTDVEDKTGLYYAACAEDPADQWRGAELWRSNNGVDYARAAGIAAETTIGLTRNGTYFNESVGPSRWDRSSSLVVEIFDGSLESASEEAVIEGANRAIVQSGTGEYEVIAFATATLVDTRKYELTNLLRGLRGTGHLMREHGTVDKRFAMAETSAGFFERGIGTNSFFKIPSLGGSLSSFDAQRVLIEGRSIRPFSPWNFTGVYLSNDDLVLNWDRRTKYIRGLFTANALAPDENPESYEVDIILGNDPVYGNVVRTIAVAGQRTITYDAATQTTDGFAPGGGSSLPVAANVYQISQSVGRSPYSFGIFFRF